MSDIEQHPLCASVPNSGMPHRKLRIVRLTPIALALCEHCNEQFHSRKRLPEEAKTELAKQFDIHLCQHQDAKQGGSFFRSSQRFSEVIDKLPPHNWIALTPDKKVVAGIGATQEEAARNARSDYGLQNPILMSVSDASAEEEDAQKRLQNVLDEK